ncbi:MAG: hypothetical protein KDA96_16670, partial [Planctomycetaceae bacterium]|nr:hypothetical protein [Planctomycetaceae bacterium]
MTLVAHILFFSLMWLSGIPVQDSTPQSLSTAEPQEASVQAAATPATDPEAAGKSATPGEGSSSPSLRDSRMGDASGAALLTRQLQSLLPPQTTVQTLDLEPLKVNLASGDYVPLSAERILNLLRQHQSPLAQVPWQRPRIRSARYTAELTGKTLSHGTMQLEVYEDDAAAAGAPLHLGRINLSEVRIRHGEKQLEMGSDGSQNLFVMQPGIEQLLSGTWAADGIVTGDNVSFRLEIPNATV